MNTDKNTVLQQLRVRENIYVILSGCTRMPFVLCDPETYDDEVFIFFEKDDADHEAKKLNEEAQPVQVIKIENKNFLAFYSGLYPMGVNCMFVNCGTENEIKIQLEELVRKPEDQKLPDGLKSGMGHGETSGKSYFVCAFAVLSDAISITQMRVQAESRAWYSASEM